MTNKKWLLIIIIGAVLIRLAIAWAPISWLLDNSILPDDAFYYFEIAENFTSDYMITFDDLSPTNGFHPLWLFSIIPIFFLTSSKFLAIHLVLTLSAFISGLGIYFLYKLLSLIDIKEKIKLGLCSAYAFLPTFLLTPAGTMNGMETGLNLAVIILYLLFYIKAFRWLRGHKLKVNHILFLILFGFITGLLFLARTDNTILILLTWLFLFFEIIRNKIWPKLYKGLVSIMTFILTVAPWILWNLITFGDVVQISAKSVPVTTHRQVSEQGWNVFDYFIQFLQNSADSLIYLFGVLIRSKKEFEYLVILFIFMTILLFFIHKFKSFKFDDKFRKNVFILAPVLLTPPIFLLIQTVRAVHLRAWYHFSIIPILLVSLGIILHIFLENKEKLSSWFLKLLSISLISWIALASVTLIDHLNQSNLNSTASLRMEAIDYMNDTLPEETLVGSWNAGMFGYFYENGNLINLDGVVNNEIFKNIKNKTLKSYVLDKEIKYLVDNEGAFVNKDFWGKDRTAREDVDIIHIIKSESDIKNILITKIK